MRELHGFVPASPNNTAYVLHDKGEVKILSGGSYHFWKFLIRPKSFETVFSGLIWSTVHYVIPAYLPDNGGNGKIFLSVWGNRMGWAINGLKAGRLNKCSMLLTGLIAQRQASVAGWWFSFWKLSLISGWPAVYFFWFGGRGFRGHWPWGHLSGSQTPSRTIVCHEIILPDQYVEWSKDHIQFIRLVVQYDGMQCLRAMALTKGYDARKVKVLTKRCNVNIVASASLPFIVYCSRAGKQMPFLIWRSNSTILSAPKEKAIKTAHIPPKTDALAVSEIREQAGGTGRFQNPCGTG